MYKQRYAHTINYITVVWIGFKSVYTQMAKYIYSTLKTVGVNVDSMLN